MWTGLKANRSTIFEISSADCEFSRIPRISIRDADQLKLEQLLRDTAVLVRRRQLNPQSEREIQNVMHDYLGVYFPTYTTQPHVHGALKKFEPDGGVSFDEQVLSTGSRFSLTAKGGGDSILLQKSRLLERRDDLLRSEEL
jgi:hypothetical protein